MGSDSAQPKTMGDITAAIAGLGGAVDRLEKQVDAVYTAFRPAIIKARLDEPTPDAEAKADAKPISETAEKLRVLEDRVERAVYRLRRLAEESQLG